MIPIDVTAVRYVFNRVNKCCLFVQDKNIWQRFFNYFSLLQNVLRKRSCGWEPPYTGHRNSLSSAFCSPLLDVGLPQGTPQEPISCLSHPITASFFKSSVHLAIETHSQKIFTTFYVYFSWPGFCSNATNQNYNSKLFQTIHNNWIDWILLWS